MPLINAGTSLAKTRTAGTVVCSSNGGAVRVFAKAVPVSIRAHARAIRVRRTVQIVVSEEDQGLRVPKPAIELLQQPGLCIGTDTDQPHWRQLAQSTCQGIVRIGQECLINQLGQVSAIGNRE